jgi:homocysteine S-methyltransferase
MKTIFFDGAFGTYYNQLTGITDSCEWANINDPDTVKNIHRQYLNAGATAIKTNTYGANSLLCEDDANLTDLIAKGYALAKEAAKGTDALVFADIGGINLPAEEAAAEYIKLSRLFLDLGATHFLFETLSELEPLLPALAYIKERFESAFIIISFAVSQDGYTARGIDYKELIDRAYAAGTIDAAGLNCISGPSHMLELIRQLDLKGRSFCVMPNGGYPSTRGGRTFFENNAQYFAEKLYEIHTHGATMVGGCCGTTPEHIRLSVERIKNGLPPAPQKSPKAKKQAPADTVPHTFMECFDKGQKVIAVELNPPIDNDVSFLLSASRKAKEKGADIITITDSPLARTRADSFIISAKIKREVKIEVLPHLCCRDKNHIGIKASLLGGHIEDIRNILVITGDPVTQSERDRYRGVFSFNSFDLISFIANLNGSAFADAPYGISAALNVNAPSFGAELARAKKKIEVGASLLLTQPIFTLEGIQNLKTAKEELNCKLLAGIMPVGGYKNACFLNNEVTGIHIPAEVVDSLNGKTPEEVLNISADFSMSIIKQAYPYCDGFYLMTPLKRIDIVCELVDRIKELDKNSKGR